MRKMWTNWYDRINIVSMGLPGILISVMDSEGLGPTQRMEHRQRREIGLHSQEHDATRDS